ncbi:MAG: DUF2283 domain-containing protein [Acetobacteraceae bacterium]|nr:DUF2283 domain-containing protein [Acetobacteraceae bacterium]
MEITHDRDQDRLFIEIPHCGEQVAVSREVHPGVVLYLDAHGLLLGLEVTGERAKEQVPVAAIRH